MSKWGDITAAARQAGITPQAMWCRMQRAQGLCRFCDTPAEKGKSRCAKHRQHENAMKKQREQRRGKRQKPYGKVATAAVPLAYPNIMLL